jgi:hypothetical protein
MRIVLYLVLAGLAVWLPERGGAAVYTYSFGSTLSDSTTPLVNLPPDSGPPGFTTTFTTSPLTNSFEVLQWIGPTLISGSSLVFNTSDIDGTLPGNLNMSFSSSVNSISLVIEIAAGASGVTVTDSAGDSQVFTPNAIDQESIPAIEMNFSPTNSFAWMNLAFIPNGDFSTFLAVGNITIITPPPPPAPSVQVSGTNMVLNWAAESFTLQVAPGNNGAFADVPGATSPYTNSMTGAQMYFRLRPN